GSESEGRKLRGSLIAEHRGGKGKLPRLNCARSRSGAINRGEEVSDGLLRVGRRHDIIVEDGRIFKLDTRPVDILVVLRLVALLALEGGGDGRVPNPRS